MCEVRKGRRKVTPAACSEALCERDVWREGPECRPLERKAFTKGTPPKLSQYGVC